MITPAGRATIAIPKNEDIIAIDRPIVVIGYKSPYPTVVRDTVAQYTASKYVSKDCGSTLKIISVVTRIYATAKLPTASNDSLEFFSTFANILSDFEYLTNFTTRITRTIRTRRATLNNFKVELKNVNDGSMDSKSTIAIGDKG